MIEPSSAVYFDSRVVVREREPAENYLVEAVVTLPKQGGVFYA